MPAVSFVMYGLMLGLDLPLPISPTPEKSTTQVLGDLPIVSALLMFIAFFILALGEELGWSGYVLDPLQQRWSALRTSLILDAVGVAWHLVPLLVIMQRPPVWIAWWCVYAVAFRVLVVWLFNLNSSFGALESSADQGRLRA